MKKGKMLYLVGSIIVLVILMIPYFQNTMTNPPMQFFWATTTVLGSYMWIVSFGMALGVCILLYIQSLLDEVAQTEPEKFNLE
ncbi:MAG: hypothetical protein CR971_02595 [candidate division SR1 bacterium]|nr:MAG: hypothetical protein CR971_02595 [candidate division SR1 bacterium]